MGCGSSTAAGAGAPMAKDPEDFHLEHIDFKKLGLEKWDTFLDEVEEPVNVLIDISNDVNGIIDAVKDATAIVVGAYKVDLQVDGKDSDRVLLQLARVDGKAITADEVNTLDEKAKAADKKLAQARDTLHKAAPTGLKLVGDALDPAAGGAQTAAFNAALAELRAALGANYKVSVAVKAAGAAGAKGVSAVIAKPVFQKDSDKYDLVPVTLLDVAKTAKAKDIYASEASVADTAAALAKAMKGMPAGSYKFDVKKKKIVVTFPKLTADTAKAEAGASGGEPVAEGDEDDGDRTSAARATPKAGGDDDDDKPAAGGDDDDKKENDKEEKKASGGSGKAANSAAMEAAQEKRAGLKKAVANFNSQLFKLNKASASINGPVTLAKAILCIVDAVVDKVKAVQKDAIDPSKLTSFIKINPSCKAGEDGELDFDLGLTINLPEFEGMGIDQIIKKLPSPVQLVYKTVFSIKDSVKEMVPKFGELKTQAMEVIDRAGETFENPTDTIKEHFGDEINPMQIVKFAGSATQNLMKVKDAAKVVMVFVQTVKRVADELNASFNELKAKFPAAA